MNYKFYLLAIFFFTVNISSWAQIIEFNDSKFKNILVSNELVNTNGDDEIQVSEAEQFSGKLELTNAPISDLTGLEYFNAMTELVYYSSVSTVLDVSKNVALERLMCGNLANLKLGNNESLSYLFTDLNNFTSLTIENSHLDTLLCWHNNYPLTIDLSAATSLTFLDLNDNLISSLDVSNLPELKTLNFDVNSISSIDLSNNPLLTHLDCFYNPMLEINLSKNQNLKQLRCSNTQITSLDVSQNLQLEKLFCDFSLITELDLSAHEHLVWLDCYNSSLTTLNVKNGNNSNVQYFDLRENLNLECIQVDNAEYSEVNWTNISSSTVFKENCDGVLGTYIDKSIQYNAYPNPTTDRLFIDLNEVYNDVDIEIFNSKLQLNKKYNFNNKSSVELELDMTPGLYFIKMTTESKTSTFKILKEE